MPSHRQGRPANLHVLPETNQQRIACCPARHEAGTVGQPPAPQRVSGQRLYRDRTDLMQMQHSMQSARQGHSAQAGFRSLAMRQHPAFLRVIYLLAAFPIRSAGPPRRGRGRGEVTPRLTAASGRPRSASVPRRNADVPSSRDHTMERLSRAYGEGRENPSGRLLAERHHKLSAEHDRWFRRDPDGSSCLQTPSRTGCFGRWLYWSHSTSRPPRAQAYAPHPTSLFYAAHMAGP